MNSQKTKITSKKFYGKWLYKISLKVNGAPMLRSGSLEYVKDFCTGPEPTLGIGCFSYAARNYKHKNELLRLAEFLIPRNNTPWAKRVESSIVDLYTNEKQFYEDVSKEFDDVLINRFEPDSDTSELLEQSSSIIVKTLPHNKYRYRVYLLPHKFKGDKNEKTRYIGWLKSQNPKITCTTAIETWILKTDWNWDRRYILVEDEATLLMLKLRNAEVMGRVYNFVISDK
jgi:hypothetical protein